MIDLFSYAANEGTAGSAYYLTSLFGSIGNVLPIQGATPGPGILGKMFSVFNTTVLALGTIIVTYTTVMAILLTAHEGEFLGKKFHSLWVPVRTVMGIAALVPTSGGYSYLQMIMMWFILQGVGAADTLWTSTVNYIVEGGSVMPSSASVAMDNARNTRAQVGQLFQGLACQSAAYARYGSGYFCYDHPADLFCRQSHDDLLDINNTRNPKYSGHQYGMGPGGSCGTLTLATTGANANIQNQALGNIVSSLAGVADLLVNIDYSYNQYYNATNNTTSSSSSTSPAPPTWLQAYCSAQNISDCTGKALASYPPPTSAKPNTSTITQLYWPYGLQPTTGDFIGTNATLYVNSVLSPSSTTKSGGQDYLSTVRTNAIDNGWIFAGAYFYYIAKVTSSVNAVVTSINVKPDPASMSAAGSPAMTANSEAGNLVTALTSSYGSAGVDTVQGQQLTGAAAIAVGAIEGTIAGAAVGSTAGPLGTAAGGIAGGFTAAGMAARNGMSYECTIFYFPAGEYCRSLIDAWINGISGSDTKGTILKNPVIAAQSMGQTLLTTVEVGTTVIIGINIVLGILSMIYPLGVGVPGMTAAIDAFIVPILMLFAGIFFVLGGTLAIYTPLIPYMVFAFGGIGWLTATIETMVAAPIVAIGLLYPEGQHELWGKAEQALMLILNIFLRPSLMIFGMISGLLMSYVAVSFINSGFLGVVTMVAPTMGIVETALFMAVYTSFFVTTLNKCFELIHVIPDKVLRWIGGGVEQFGEAASLEKVAGAAQAAAEKAGGILKEQVKGGDFIKQKGAQKTQGDETKERGEQTELLRKIAGSKDKKP